MGRVRVGAISTYRETARPDLGRIVCLEGTLFAPSRGKQPGDYCEFGTAIRSSVVVAGTQRQPGSRNTASRRGPATGAAP